MSIETGIISLVYNACKDIFRFVIKRYEKEDPSHVIASRQKWKAEIQSKLRKIDDTVGYGEAIIRDVRRVDNYPNVKERQKGISSWFGVGLIGLYHKGLEVRLRIEALKYDESKEVWRYSDWINGEKADLNAHLVGRIPFERIESIDWDGDEYYSVPHVYCRFSSKIKEPYEELVFCEKRDDLDGHHYYHELSSLMNVNKISKKIKTGIYAGKKTIK